MLDRTRLMPVARTATALSAAAQRLATLLLPHQCVLCRQFADTTGLCATCWGGLTPIAAPLCARCGLPLGHTLADPLCAECWTNPPPLDAIRAIRICFANFADGQTVFVGRASWLADSVPMPNQIDRAALVEIQSSSEADGLSVLHVVRNGCSIGWIGLEDNARPEAAGAVDRLIGWVST